MRTNAFIALALWIGASFVSAQSVTIQNPGFGPLGGHISGTLDLNILNPAPTSVTQQLGTSGWYGLANAATVGNLGFRPQIEVDDSSASSGHGYISYALGASLGGVAGLEMPDAYLWQPMTGWSLAASTTYKFSIDLDAGSLLDIAALGARGFGLGVTTGATGSSLGTFLADSSSAPSLLGIALLSGTTQRLALTFTTGFNPPAGDVGIAVFAGRGTQTLQVSLLSNFSVDNAAFAVVPEPSALLMILSALGVFFIMRRRSGSRVG
jgi:hypothetical protein